VQLLCGTLPVDLYMRCEMFSNHLHNNRATITVWYTSGEAPTTHYRVITEIITDPTQEITKPKK
jgi:hypothetical protein